jgi:purine-binding chemotaxis protein CheW
MPNQSADVLENITEYVSVYLGSQLFGLPIERVQDVFVPGSMTAVPLAGPEIAGLINLRGRIVTAIEMRRRLGLPDRERGAQPMAVGVELNGESYGLMIDSVGEVLKLPNDSREPAPVNLDARLARVSAGIHRLEDQLLVILDVERVLDLENVATAA